jgi:nucleotide-binding universal stress UspA family protein
MIKTILVLVGGSERDEVVLQTALAAARPFSAHLKFLHIHVSPGQAARFSHAEFARGLALRNALEQLDNKAKTFSELAADHIRDFCARSMIEFCDAPTKAENVTASFREEQDNALERLTFHARHSDLIVMGRAKQSQGLPPDTLERLVLSCGRPMLVATSAPPQNLTGTIMVCWKESANAARAVAAATPILTQAKRVVFASVVERDDSVTEAMHHLARQFAWNQIPTEVQIVPADGRKIPASLSAAAEACGADLVVMGAYGRSRARGLLFGSCTEAFIHHADRPILLMH